MLFHLDHLECINFYNYLCITTWKMKNCLRIEVKLKSMKSWSVAVVPVNFSIIKQHMKLADDLNKLIKIWDFFGKLIICQLRKLHNTKSIYSRSSDARDKKTSNDANVKVVHFSHFQDQEEQIISLFARFYYKKAVSQEKLAYAYSNLSNCFFS